jgi:CHAD domain-containing protein
MSKKRISRPEATSALRPAAKSIIRSRLRSATRLVKDISAGCVRKPEYIHQLRVAIRRAEAAISAFEPELRSSAVTSARRRLRTVRKAAGAVRDCDVHRTLLKSVQGLDSEELRPVARYLARRLSLARDEAAGEVVGIARPRRVRKLKEARRGLIDLPRRSDNPAASPSTLLGAALRTFSGVTSATRAAAGADLSNLESLHALRVSAKQVRYAVEIFRHCLPDSLCDSTLTQLREFQAVLGRVNDARQMSTWLASEAKHLAGAARPKSIPKGATAESIHEELRVIVGRLDAELAAAHAAALPQVAQKLDAALRPLEDWTRSALPLREESSVERTIPAGRRAEGSGDRHAHSPRRATVPA